MSISSLVIQTRPENVERIREELVLMDGVDVHTTTEEGNLVVTVDNPDNAKASETFNRFLQMDGVLNTSLIYNYFETENAEKELTQ